MAVRWSTVSTGRAHTHCNDQYEGDRDCTKSKEPSGYNETEKSDKRDR